MKEKMRKMAVIICCFFAVGLHGQTVGPLLTTQWGQSQPFRDMCPQLNNSNIRCPVGCVATAMAQIMKYHQYPAQGVGQSTAYVTGLGASIPSVSFAVNYDWNNMLDFYLGNITTAQEDSAVALLSYHCGVSVRMEYGPMSAAAIYSVAEALPTYFGYDKGILYRERAYYSDSIWENMLKTELDSGRPVFYSGGMHAFVCDGYDNNGMFHFNWGWNGGSDGYFLSSALNLGDEPGAGSATFNTNQAIVVNIKPDAGGTPTKYECALRNYFASPLTSAMPGDTLTITTFFMFFQDNFPGGDLGVALVDSNDQIAAVIGSLSSVPNERSMWTFGPWDIHCTVPLGTPYGQYKLKALVKDTGNWEIITLSSGCPNYIDFRIGLPIAATGINLNKSVDTIAFFVYDSEQLTKSIVPNNATNHAVIWSSSDTNLMNVGNGLLNSGLVTAKLTGTAIITATAVAGGFKDSSYVEATACKKSTTGSLAWEMCDDGTLTISGSGNMPNYNNPDLFEDGPPWHLYRKFITTVIIGDSVTRIGENAFIRCPNLTSVSIPKSITHIGDGAFGGCSSLDSITIPNSVTSIGNNAFYGCSSLKTLYFNATNCANFTHGNLWLYGDTSLTSVIIGNNVQTIPDYAFYDCNKLTAVIIPDSVVSIGTQAFSICSGLTSVTIGNSVASIGGHAFIGCSGLDSITIPESVESIGVGAFVNCSSLASLHFNAINCTIASSGWLSGDTSLTSVTIGEQVQTIPDLAFFECDKLTSVSIPDNVVRIGSWAFYGCSGLDSITIPESVASIGDRSFMFCSGLTILYFNAVNCANFTSTANHWLYGDTSLTSVIIGESVQTIPDYAFFNCNKLTAVIIPDSVATIGYAAFNVCSGLTSVTIGNNVVSIGNNAFSGCSGLTSVTIGNSVASIGNNAFYGCNGLDSIITYATTPPVLGFSVFSGIPINIPVYIPCLTYNLYSTATEWRNFTNFIINGTPTADTTFYSVVKCDNLPYTDDNFTTPIYSTGTYYNTLQNANGCDSIICLNIVYSNGTIGSLIWTICDSVLTISGNDTMPDYLSDVFVPWYPYRTAINAIVIDSGVATIGNSAFYGCSGLTSVIIPESVVSIGNNAFYGCSGLTSVIIPESVVSIGNNAFYGCSGLTSVIIPENVASIGNDAFRDCSGLTTLYFNAKNCAIPSSWLNGDTSLTSVIIGEQVQTIPNYAFYDCNKLTAVTIPENVASIGDAAFMNCRGLTTLYFNAVNCANFTSSSYWLGGDTSLTSIIIGEQVQTIPDYAFFGCNKLTDVIIPDSVVSIGNGAFCACSGLTSVTIGNSVVSIGQQVFASCSGLTEITSYPTTPPSCGMYPFLSVTATIPVYIPCGSYNSYRTASEWSGFSNFVVNNGKAELDTLFYGAVKCGNIPYSDNYFTNLTQAGIYYDTVKTINDCDSIVCLTLAEYPSVAVTYDTVNVCSGETYNFFGKVLSVAGTYFDTLPNVNGCDSVIQLAFGVYPSVAVTYDTVNVCSGETYNFFGKVLSVAGTYYDTLYNITGCDSVIQLAFGVYPSVAVTFDTVNICSGETYNFFGKVLSVAGTYFDTLPNVNGCDSVIQLAFGVYPSVAVTYDTVNICFGETYNFLGKVLSVAGTYYDTLPNVNGCDSVIQLAFGVYPSVAVTFDTVNICSGETYNFFGKVLSVAGTYYDTLYNITGCDSVIQLAFGVYPSVAVTFDTVNICSGETYNFFGKVLSVAGTYYDTLPNVNGCDSVIQLAFGVYPSVAVTFDTVNVCSGETYNFLGKVLSVAGTYYDTLPNVNGCDSVIQLAFGVYPSVTITYDTVNVCAGETYNFAGKVLSVAGTYYDTLPNVNGCDSVIQLAFGVYPSVAVTYDTVNVCSGETYNFLGKVLSVAGTYYDTLYNITGCDSVIELTLTVNPAPATPTITKNEDTLISSSPTGNQWYLDSVLLSGAINQTYICTQNGKYSVAVTNEHSCTAISAEMEVLDVDIVETLHATSLRIYPNPTDGKLHITYAETRHATSVQIFDVVGQCVGTYRIRPEYTETTIDISHLANGLYFLKIDGKTVKVVKQ